MNRVLVIACPDGHGPLVDVGHAEGKLYCRHAIHDGRPASHPAGPLPPSKSWFSLADLEAAQAARSGAVIPAAGSQSPRPGVVTDTPAGEPDRRQSGLPASASRPGAPTARRRNGDRRRASLASSIQDPVAAGTSSPAATGVTS